jgi:hypothetical protein
LLGARVAVHAHGRRLARAYGVTLALLGAVTLLVSR